MISSPTTAAIRSRITPRAGGEGAGGGADGCVPGAARTRRTAATGSAGIAGDRSKGRYDDLVAGRLLVVATPIGNLDDLSPRAREALASANVVLCEDTRRTQHLFARHGLSTPRISCHEHNEHRRTAEVLERLGAGQTVALVSDAGTPAVSDPGQRLVAAAAAAGHRVESLPGPSAVLAILSTSGFAAVPFTFLGFPPARRGERDRWYVARAGREGTSILFESPFRVAGSLRALAAAWGDPEIAVGRELTKLHEEILRGRASEVAAILEERPGIRGEFAIAVAPQSPRAPQVADRSSSRSRASPESRASRAAQRTSG
jgi:16S rRNA (cytidine1402-2'-O)-methyltransferase